MILLHKYVHRKYTPSCVCVFYVSISFKVGILTSLSMLMPYARGSSSESFISSSGGVPVLVWCVCVTLTILIILWPPAVLVSFFFQKSYMVFTCIYYYYASTTKLKNRVNSIINKVYCLYILRYRKKGVS